MSIDTREQEAYFEEILKKIDSIRDDETVSPSDSNNGTEKINKDVGSVIDQDIFDRVKMEHKEKNATRVKSPIKRMLDGDEDDTEEEVEIGSSSLYDDPQPDIEEFESEDEVEEIYRDLKNTVGKMAVKSLAAFILVCASLYLFAAGFYPGLFAGYVSTVWFKIAWVAVDVAVICLFFGIFSQGIGRLLRAKLDTDGLLCLLFIAVVLVRIVGFFKTDWFGPTMNFEPLLTLGLWYNLRSKKMIASTIQKNFKIISAKMDKLTATQPVSCELNNQLILETDVGSGATFMHRTKLVSNFIENSFCDYEWDHKIYHINFVLLILILAGTVAISQLAGAREAILFPVASLAIGVPLFSRYFYALSIYLNGKKIRKKGGVLTSADSAKKLEDADLLVVRDVEVLGDDSVLLQGVKAIGDLQIDELITYVAALFQNISVPYSDLFLKMVDQRTVELPRVDDIYPHTGLGFSCLIHSKMFLVGNMKMMREFNIKVPDKVSDLNLGSNRFPVYVAYHKQAVGIFIISYERNKNTETGLKMISDTGIDLGVVTSDFNFSIELLRSLYPDIDLSLVHILSKDTARQAKEYLTRVDKRGDLVASISGFCGIASCFRGIHKLLTALKINFVIRILYPLVALALMFFIGLSGYSDNTVLQILIFQIIWMLPICAICRFCK